MNHAVNTPQAGQSGVYNALVRNHIHPSGFTLALVLYVVIAIIHYNNGPTAGNIIGFVKIDRCYKYDSGVEASKIGGYVHA